MQKEDEILIFQTKYIKELIKNLGINESKLVETLIDTQWKLRKDDQSLEVDHKLYFYLIGGLLYLSSFRQYIMHVVYLVSRYQATMRQSHEVEVKMIFKYLRGTLDSIKKLKIISH